MTHSFECGIITTQSNELGGEKMRIDRIKFVATLTCKDITCKRLSELSGVSRGTITSVKTGKSCSRETAEKLASGLGVKVSDIIEEVQ